MVVPAEAGAVVVAAIAVVAEVNCSVVVAAIAVVAEACAVLVDAVDDAVVVVAAGVCGTPPPP
jgi:hypothetical protein